MATKSTNPMDNPVVCANTKFGLDVLRAVSNSQKPGSNLFFSPFSVSTALAMTSLGARGNTAAEMKSGLCFPSDVADDDLHRKFSDLLSTINAPDAPYALHTANRVYTRLGKAFNEEFLTSTMKHYNAQAKPVNFQGDPNGVKKEINDWVEEQTANKIKDLIPSISQDMAMILVNAIYFKGNWADKFDPKQTQMKPFQVTKDSKVDTDFMFNKKSFQYGESEELDCQVLGLPYEQEHLSFYVFVPKEVDGLAKLEANIRQEHFTDVFRQFRLRKSKVSVFLPKFKMEQDITMNQVLAQLGMRDMFVAQQADFSGMDGTREMYVDTVLHKAFIDVNEEGTEAAAATAVMMRCCCIEQPLTVVADRPFLFCIRDNRNGSILFLGRYASPPTE